MEQTRSSGAGYVHPGAYLPEIAESLRFQEEIHSLIHPTFDTKNSFTALLGLPPNQAVELLHDPDSGPPPPGEVNGAGDEMWRLRLGDHTALRFPVRCSPSFPAFADFAALSPPEDSPTSSSCGGGRFPKQKVEPPDSESPPIPSDPGEKRQRPAAKRKNADKNGKVKGPAKKSKCVEECTRKEEEAAEGTSSREKLPYVHVRARRGQATDSHSLAERARREKINARMKFLQELVPGCSKISGTALVLDEIINHVQSLQRQVEFLSMRLAAVNPRIDFPGFDGFYLAEFGGWLQPGNRRNASWSPNEPDNGDRPYALQQNRVELNQQEPQAAVPMTMWVRDDGHPYNNASVSPQNSLLAYSSANSAGSAVTRSSEIVMQHTKISPSLWKKADGHIRLTVTEKSRTTTTTTGRTTKNC